MTGPAAGWVILGPNVSAPPAPRKYSAIDGVLGEQGAALRREAKKQELGVGYGFQDEALGPIADEFGAGVAATSDYVRGLVTGNRQSLGSLYDDHLALRRDDQDTYRANNPVTSVGANVLGGAAIAPTKVAQGALTFGQALWQGAKAGAIGGGTAGYAEGRGGVEGRLNSAAIGAAAGATLGAGIPALTRSVQIVSTGVGRLKGLKGQGAERRAAEMIQKAMEQDGITPQMITDMRATGKPISLADLGPTTRRLVGAAGRQSEEGGRILEEFFEPRTEGQYGRISDDMANLLGVQGDDFSKVGGQVVSRRASLADRGYQVAYSQPAPKLSDRGRALLKTPTGKQALSRATRQMADMELPMTDEAGNYTVRALDQIQRAMRELGDVSKGQRAGETATIRSGMRERFLKELPEDLRDTMSMYRTESELLGALEDGRKFFRGDSESVMKSVEDMNGLELEMYRLGAAREVLERMGGKIDSGDVSGMFQNENIRRRLRSIFPDAESFDDFIELARIERTMQNTRNDVLKGSQTAGRQAADDQFGESALGEAALDVASGAGSGVSVMSAIINLGRKGATRYLQGLNEEVGAAVARRATTALPSTPPPGVPSPSMPGQVPALPGAGQRAVEGTAGRAGAVGGANYSQPSGPEAGWVIVQPPTGSQGQAAQPNRQGIAPQSGLMDDAQGRVVNKRGATPPALGIEAGSAFDLARQFVGLDEKRNGAVIGSFIKSMTGKKLDPAKTAWCAAYVNAVLAASGVEGTDSNLARSFLNFGTETTKPKRGDLAVFTRGDPNGWQGHVGFYAGEVTKNGQKYIKVLGGNQSDGVNEALYPANRLLSYRRPPRLTT